jgi:hypothetical protein
MVRDHVNGNSGFVILVVQEVLKVILGSAAQPQPHELYLRINAVDGFNDDVIDACIDLRRHLMFAVNLVEDLPVVYLVVMTGLVALAIFVRESALRVPTHQPCIVVPNFFQARIPELCSFLIVPDHLVRVRRIRHRLLRLEHPLGNGAEVEDRGVPRRGVHEILRHGVDKGKVPGSLTVLRRLELRDDQLGVSRPGNVAHVVSTKPVQNLKGPIVNL